MQLFHTSTREIQHPDISFSREYLDFGKGFYLTSIKSQAIDYGARFKLRGKQSILNEYNIEDNVVFEYRTKIFSRYDEEWLDFITSCRQEMDVSDWDVVIGPIADDKVFRTIDLYLSGDMGKEEALRRLDPLKPNHQLCIRNQEIINRELVFVKSEEL